MNTFELDLEAVGVLLLVIGHIEVAERTEHRRRLRAHRTLRGEQHTSDDTDDNSGVLHDYTLLVVGPSAHRSLRRGAVLERGECFSAAGKEQPRCHTRDRRVSAISR